MSNKENKDKKIKDLKDEELKKVAGGNDTTNGFREDILSGNIDENLDQKSRVK